MLRWENEKSLSGYDIINGYSGKAVVFKIYWNEGFYRLQAFLPGYKEDFTKKDDRDIIMKIYAETIFFEMAEVCEPDRECRTQRRGEIDNG